LQLRKGKIMFGLTPDDAAAVMEHAAVVRTTYSRVNAENQAAHDSRIRNGQTAMLAVRSSQVDRQKLQQKAVELAEIANNRNDYVAAGWAAGETIKVLVQELSRLSGEPESVVSEKVNRLRTKNYDFKVDEYLREGYLQKDYRKDPEQMLRRTWYVPS
jgi:hypothetical protein